MRFQRGRNRRLTSQKMNECNEGESRQQGGFVGLENVKMGRGGTWHGRLERGVRAASWGL